MASIKKNNIPFGIVVASGEGPGPSPTGEKGIVSSIIDINTYYPCVKSSMLMETSCSGEKKEN